MQLKKVTEADRKRLKAAEQKEQLARVNERIGALILDFYNKHGHGYVFTLHEITLFVMKQVVCSPTSPYRIMSSMKTAGIISYTVIDRSQSQYRISDPLSFEE